MPFEWITDPKIPVFSRSQETPIGPRLFGVSHAARQLARCNSLSKRQRPDILVAPFGLHKGIVLGIWDSRWVVRGKRRLELEFSIGGEGLVGEIS